VDGALVNVTVQINLVVVVVVVVVARSFSKKPVSSV